MKITCESRFAGKKLSSTIKLETCRKKPKLRFNLEIAVLGIDWTETFTDSKEVEIPGFSYLGSGVFLKVQLQSSENGNTNIKVGYL